MSIDHRSRERRLAGRERGKSLGNQYSEAFFITFCNEKRAKPSITGRRKIRARACKSLLESKAVKTGGRVKDTSATWPLGEAKKARRASVIAYDLCARLIRYSAAASASAEIAK